MMIKIGYDKRIRGVKEKTKRTAGKSALSLASDFQKTKIACK